jgi:hypothetical protein
LAPQRIKETTKMRKTTLVVVLTLIAVFALAVAPVAAVTDGELDNGRHPYVGLMVAQDAKGNPLWRCSGTLLSPTLFLTERALHRGPRREGPDLVCRRRHRRGSA